MQLIPIPILGIGGTDNWTEIHSPLAEWEYIPYIIDLLAPINSFVTHFGHTGTKYQLGEPPGLSWATLKWALHCWYEWTLIKKKMEDNLRWKKTVMEKDTRWKMTFYEWWSSIADGLWWNFNLQWKTPLDEWQSKMEDILNWKLAISKRQPSMEEDPRSSNTNLNLILCNQKKTENQHTKLEFDISNSCYLLSVSSFAIFVFSCEATL